MAGLIFISAFGNAADSAAESEGGEFLSVEEPKLSAWSHSERLGAAVGFKDNPLLSPLNRQSSGFSHLSGEASLIRLPLEGPELSLLGSLEHTEYFEEELSSETIAVADMRGEHAVSERWSLIGQVGYFYLRQVFDASEIEGIPLVVPAVGHTLYGRPGGSIEFGGGWRLGMEVETLRQWLDDPLDSFFDVAPRLELVRRTGSGRELGMAYRYRDRRFDRRSPVDLFGDPIVGRLRIQQHDAELFWRRTWGREGAWRATARAGWLRSSDNGVGFLDYIRLQGVAALRWVAPRWEIRGEIRSRWYYYDAQVVDALEGTGRRRWEAAWSLRPNWRINRAWSVYALYEGELTDENLVAGDYRVNSVSVGVAWEH